MIGEREARGKSIHSVKKTHSIFTKWILFPSRQSAASAFAKGYGGRNVSTQPGGASAETGGRE